jgi:hypothetical protein
MRHPPLKFYKKKHVEIHICQEQLLQINRARDTGTKHRVANKYTKEDVPGSFRICRSIPNAAKRLKCNSVRRCLEGVHMASAEQQRHFPNRLRLIDINQDMRARSPTVDPRQQSRYIYA